MANKKKRIHHLYEDGLEKVCLCDSASLVMPR